MPSLDPRAPQTATGAYTFPSITGNNVSTNAAYYTAPNGGGTRYDVGDTLSHDPSATYPITFYIYDGTTGCSDEESFQLTENAAGRPFITTWQTTIANESITINTRTGITGYNFTVD